MLVVTQVFLRLRLGLKLTAPRPLPREHTVVRVHRREPPACLTQPPSPSRPSACTRIAATAALLWEKRSPGKGGCTPDLASGRRMSTLWC